VDAAPDETEVLDRVVEWAAGETHVRAVILTSTRARPDAAIDEPSDYDVILAVPDLPQQDTSRALTPGHDQQSR
jgi:Streptomycin adenylyltransferase